jgi:hypothetical protein
MDPRLAAVLSLIPERTARVSTGSAFLLPDAAACAHPERVALLAGFLHWLSPLERLSKDDQRALGLVAANGRPVSGNEAVLGDEEVLGEEEIMADDALDEELEVPGEYERHGSLGTQIAP